MVSHQTKPSMLAEGQRLTLVTEGGKIEVEFSREYTRIDIRIGAPPLNLPVLTDGEFFDIGWDEEVWPSQKAKDQWLSLDHWDSNQVYINMNSWSHGTQLAADEAADRLFEQFLAYMTTKES